MISIWNIIHSSYWLIDTYCRKSLIMFYERILNILSSNLKTGFVSVSLFRRFLIYCNQYPCPVALLISKYEIRRLTFHIKSI